MVALGAGLRHVRIAQLLQTSRRGHQCFIEKILTAQLSTLLYAYLSSNPVPKQGVYHARTIN